MIGLWQLNYDTYVLDSILCKCLEKTASIVVLYRVVDSAGSLLILKSNSSKRNCNNGFEFSLEKLMLKSPAKTSGMLHKFLLFLLSD